MRPAEEPRRVRLGGRPCQTINPDACCHRYKAAGETRRNLRRGRGGGGAEPGGWGECQEGGGSGGWEGGEGGARAIRGGLGGIGIGFKACGEMRRGECDALPMVEVV